MSALALAVLCALSATAFAAAAEVLPDPTQPPTMYQSAVKRLALSEPQKFTVSAIKIGADGRSAIVNNQLVNAGDRIDDALIVEITPGAVVVDYLSQRTRVRLVPNNLFRRAPHPGGMKEKRL